MAEPVYLVARRPNGRGSRGITVYGGTPAQILRLLADKAREEGFTVRMNTRRPRRRRPEAA